MRTLTLTAVLLLCPLSLPGATDAPPALTDATGLNTGNIEQYYRHRSIRAYLPLDELRQRTKISRYSAFENPTGIYFSEGEKVTIRLTGSTGQTIRLIVHNFGQDGGHDEYPLTEGENTIIITHKGLGYLDYRSLSPQEAPAVQADILGGSINGIFTHRDDTATWQRLLREAKGGMLDIIGERCQLVYPVESLCRACPEKGPELIALYDRIIRLQQNDIMGWDADGSHPGNHVLGRVMWKGYMQADNLGAGFVYDTIPSITNPEELSKNAWGVAHEFGHVNQTRPGFCWVGMTEVTNNLFSSWVNYNLYPQDMRLEHETLKTQHGERMRGGRFDRYINSALVQRRLWQFYVDGDPFTTLAPLWQLQLYMAVARDKKDFYPQIFHAVRTTQESGMTQGELRTLFFKRACDAAQLNLSEFFVKLGMLAPMDRMVEDYNSSMMTITDDMCSDALQYAARYPMPDSSAIFYITANTVGIYRDKLPVKHTAPISAERIVSERLELSADEWANAVAFEAYRDDKLLYISLRGLNHTDNASTTIICPAGTNCIKAVQWDGQRFPILQQKL